MLTEEFIAEHARTADAAERAKAAAEQIKAEA